jgi:hypothetical protein
MDKKYFNYVNTFLVVCPMTLVMAFIGILRNYGLGEHWFIKFFNAWIIMFPIAYVFALLIIPRAKKFTDNLINHDKL